MKKTTKIIIGITIILTLATAYFQYCTEAGKEWAEDMKHCGGTLSQLPECQEYLQKKEQRKECENFKKSLEENTVKTPAQKEVEKELLKFCENF